MKRLILLCAAFFLIGCALKAYDICRHRPEPATKPVQNYISIASFNIQVFGKSKASRPEIMETLADIITNFDIVAIQEIRDKSGTAIKKLEKAVDARGRDYSFVIGPRLGRTASKEQYALMFRPDILQVLGDYTYGDSADRFHREPQVVHFQVANQPFDFVTINVHTDPDEARSEINALPQVIKDAQHHFNEQDVILLGDLNADGAYYDENNNSLPLRDSKFTWLITNDMDTSIAGSSRTYDRIIITSQAEEDYIAKTVSVFEFDKKYRLSCKPEKISDHYPVMARFSVSLDTD